MEPKREHNNGDTVITDDYNHLKMVVIGATLCVKGWRYKLGFPKKDGTIDKRREFRFYFEDNLKRA